MGHPVHEAMQRIHRVVRIADSAGTGLAEADDALCAAARQPISIVGHTIERVEAHRLRRDVDIFHRVVEAVGTQHDVGDLVDRVKIDWLLGANDQTCAVGLAPDSELVVHQREALNLLAKIHIERTNVARLGRAFGDPLLQFGAEPRHVRLGVALHVE